jgi:hypothetical protein
LTALVRRTTDFQARSAPSRFYAAALSAPARVTTPVRLLTALDLHKNKATVAPGAPLMLFGHLTTAGRGLAGRPVRYYKRSVGGPWIYVGTSRTLAPTGWHSLTVHPKIARVWKAVSAGDDRYAPRTSAYLSVRVG